MGKRYDDENDDIDTTLLMQVTKQGGLGNTTIIGQVTIRTAVTLVVVIAVGIMLKYSKKVKKEQNMAKKF